MDTSITAFCTIRDHQILLNGRLVYEHPTGSDSLNDFLIGSYRHFGIQYPKFFKMDVLCKLAFLTAELLLPTTDIRGRLSPGDIGIVLANRSSSLLTDLAHQQSIQDPANHFPSPAIFVYTLPNIMIGELSIRHQLTGDNTLFVADAFEPEALETYTALLLEENISQACLCGWIEADASSYEAFFYVVEKDDNAPTTAQLPHHSNSIHTLYTHSFNLN